MSHYGACGDNEKEFIKKHAGIEPATGGCICKAHQIEAKRIWANRHSIPKWKAGNENVPIVVRKHKCSFLGCEEIDLFPHS